MLEITEAAEAAIRTIRDQSDHPDSTALRIAPIPAPDGGVSIGFGFTEGPDEGDVAITDKEDFRVYLAAELVRPFDGAILAATSDEEGVTLELRTQAELHDNGTHISDGSSAG